MTKAIYRLNSAQIKSMTKAGMYADGGGLYLKINKTGGKFFVWRYMYKTRAREMGLGSLGIVTLQQAREKCLEGKRQLSMGSDPIELRNQASRKLSEGAEHTFAECTDAFMAAHSPTWKNPKHKQQWSNTLTTYAYPVIGNIAVQDRCSGQLR